MKPRLRPDLKWITSEKRGITRYLPEATSCSVDAGLYEIEYLIAGTLDGDRDLEEVIRFVGEEFQFTLTIEDLNRLLIRFHEMSLLVDFSGGELSRSAPGRGACRLRLTGRMVAGVVLLVLGLGGGLHFIGRSGPTAVRVAVADQVAVPFFYGKKAWSAHYVGSQWIGFSGGGTLAGGRTTVDAVIPKGELLGELVLSASLEARFGRLKEGLRAAEERRVLLEESLSGVVTRRREIQEPGGALSGELTDLSEGEEKRSGGDKRAVANKLRLLREEEAQILRVKRKVVRRSNNLQARLKRFYSNNRDYFAVSPFEGVVVEDLTKGRVAVRKGESLWHLVKANELDIETSVEVGAQYEVGDLVSVVLAGDMIVSVPVVTISKGDKGRVILRIRGNEARWWGDTGLSNLAWVKGTSENALAIPAAALFQETEDGASVWKVENERILRGRVKVLKRSKSEVMVESVDGELRGNDYVIESIVGERSLKTLKGNSRVVDGDVEW